MYNIAIILAGGTGSRIGGETPKQFLPLDDGRSILEHSVDAFEQAPSIDEIAVVIHPDHLDTLQKLCRKNTWQKLSKIIPGGSERWESSWHAILAYLDLSPSLELVKSSARSDCRWPSVEHFGVGLLFHDAARPFVSQRIIADVAAALETHEAVTVAVPVTDTLYRVEDGKVREIPDRKDFMRAQTPQAFHLDLIADAYMKALAEDEIIATDDAGIVRKYEPRHPIFIVQGEEMNRKITYKGDL